MKKLIFVFALLIIPAILLLGQVVDPPESWAEVFMNPVQWFGGLAGIAALTAFLAAFLNGLLNVTSKITKQLISWAVAIILLVGSDLLNIGYAAEFPILLAAVHGLGAGLISNGIFDIPIIKAILDFIESLFKKQKA